MPPPGFEAEARGTKDQSASQLTIRLAIVGVEAATFTPRASTFRLSNYRGHSQAIINQARLLIVKKQWRYSNDPPKAKISDTVSIDELCR
ncbi:hypothetical protein CEXT_652861 [Caerostris extrusa]|uniref:Uncharacterized protein n=1 Tax=Caerostris extrusa TaxID=172846 RepID=A0AAV4XS25_CAEEX|nr:hypothetical protein CEXT_652861 [Caerostris extrusa]